MQKNKITIICRNDSRDSQIQKKRRVFNLQGHKMVYENKFETKQNNVKFTEGVHVVNNLCELRNQKLIKTTYIYFEDKIIKIQDQIFLQSQIKNDVIVDHLNIHPIKKPTIYKIIQTNPNIIESSQSSQYQQRRRKDLKNIVKNIVKIFLNWLQNNKQFNGCKSAMQRFLKNHKYNNSLINDMSLNNQINYIFMGFLLNQAEQKIHDSRIHDKRSHMQAIKKYYKIFKDNQTTFIGQGLFQLNQHQSKYQQQNNDKSSGRTKRAQKQSKHKKLNHIYHDYNQNQDQDQINSNDNDRMENQQQNQIYNQQQNQNQGNNNKQQQNNNSSQDKKSSMMGNISNKNQWNNEDNNYNGSSGSNSLFQSSNGQIDH